MKSGWHLSSGRCGSRPTGWSRLEPAHWFDPGQIIAGEEKVLISALDEVYPELRLGDRVAATRAEIVGPGVREPAHFRRPGQLESSKAAEVLAEMASVLRRFGM